MHLIWSVLLFLVVFDSHRVLSSNVPKPKTVPAAGPLQDARKLEADAKQKQDHSWECLRLASKQKDEALDFNKQAAKAYLAARGFSSKGQDVEAQKAQSEFKALQLQSRQKLQESMSNVTAAKSLINNAWNAKVAAVDAGINVIRTALDITSSILEGEALKEISVASDHTRNSNSSCLVDAISIILAQDKEGNQKYSKAMELVRGAELKAVEVATQISYLRDEQKKCEEKKNRYNGEKRYEKARGAIDRYDAIETEIFQKQREITNVGEDAERIIMDGRALKEKAAVRALVSMNKEIETLSLILENEAKFVVDAKNTNADIQSLERQANQKFEEAKKILKDVDQVREKVHPLVIEALKFHAQEEICKAKREEDEAKSAKSQFVAARHAFTVDKLLMAAKVDNARVMCTQGLDFKKRATMAVLSAIETELEAARKYHEFFQLKVATETMERVKKDTKAFLDQRHKNMTIHGAIVIAITVLVALVAVFWYYKSSSRKASSI